MSTSKRKILVHVCCAACASYVFSELEKEDFQITGFFYNPEIHGRAEYEKRLADVKKLCENKNLELIVPEYNIQDFFSPLLPYQDKNSIKFISDKKRYRRKRCQLCLSALVGEMINKTKQLHYKYFTTTMLCSPYKDHDEIWNMSLEAAVAKKLNLFYKDFRKGYWTGRNFARTHDIMIPKYCGCNDSLEEGRLE
jgi:hypothetical protein